MYEKSFKIFFGKGSVDENLLTQSSNARVIIIIIIIIIMISGRAEAEACYARAIGIGSA
jgi:hypothetical protein